jgi:hypothetical protein
MLSMYATLVLRERNPNFDEVKEFDNYSRTMLEVRLQKKHVCGVIVSVLLCPA